MKRKVIEEGVYSKSLKVEVYPWHLKICENSKPDEQILKEFSRADTIGKPLFSCVEAKITCPNCPAWSHLMWGQV